MKAAVGAALVAVHAAAFVALAARSGGTELAVELHAPLASPHVALDGRVPAALADRVTVSTDGEGLVRRRWAIAYRGGYTREVGASQLVGPFQDPAAPPCSGRVIVGQRLLDSLAAVMARSIDDELHGEQIFGIGDYQRVENLSLRWARIEVHLLDRAFVGDVPAGGYLRASAELVFARARVPITLALVPERAGDALHLRISARADLELGNPILQWVSDKLGADRLATRLARRQIEAVLAATLAPPPPFELADGQSLQFVYCDAPLETAEGAWGALPFAVALHRLDAAPAILPPRLPAGVFAPPPAGTTLALDLDVSALDAMLFELWRTGWLDRRLAEVGLDRRFNTDPTVTEMLTIRLSPVRLALPPVITAGAPGVLRLAADARVTIAAGDTPTIGRLFGALEFRFDHVSADSLRVPVSVDLGALELACERTPSVLVPCYADLVAALRDRGGDFHGALTGAFAQLLAQVFVERRLGAPGLPASLAIHGVVPALAGSPPTLRLQLDAAVEMLQ
ncbi:MAG: hypothetical protein ACM31C_08460 [Acidobacteriota bacterium]